MALQRKAKHATGLLLAAVLTLAASAQWTPPPPEIPAFHKAPSTGPLPPLLPNNERTGQYFTRGYQQTAYKMADDIPEVLYQQPCYCWCSKVMHHKSLHSCFEGSHGAVCSVCMREAAYAYQQTRLGKTPAEIRAGIIRGDWDAVNLLEIKLDQ